MFRSTLRALLGTIVAIAIGSAAAEAYPDKPVTYVIPFNPGGESDIAARVQEPYFQKHGDEPAVIQYKPGAGGAAGWSTLNDLTGDGHTIMGVNLPHIILQPMLGDVGYATEDLSVVYMFQYTPDAIIVRKESPYQTLDDLIAEAKENPGSVTLSGTGTNTANHLAHEQFTKLAGIETTYVPYTGGGASNAALLGGHITATMSYPTTAINLGDEIRMLAVAMEERHPQFPDVPTFRELGIDLISGAYRGVAVPNSTPEAVQKEVSSLIDRINKDPAFIEDMSERGFVVTNISYDEMGEFLAEREEEYRAVLKDMGVDVK